MLSSHLISGPPGEWGFISGRERRLKPARPKLGNLPASSCGCPFYLAFDLLQRKLAFDQQALILDFDDRCQGADASGDEQTTGNNSEKFLNLVHFIAFIGCVIRRSAWLNGPIFTCIFRI